MSSRLFSRAENEACRPMPWIMSGSPDPGAHRQPLFAPAPKAAERAAEELKSQIALMEQRVREAREAGRAEGEVQGRRAAQAEVESTLHKLASAIHEASELRAHLRAQAEGDLVRLAIAIARRVVGRELNADPEAIAGLVKSALGKVRVQEVLRVRAHPDQSRTIAECLNRYGAAHAQVVADPAAERGAVIFETSRGNLDASVETQLREIERGLTDRLRKQD
jgi:flagellar assembly protein FliH